MSPPVSPLGAFHKSPLGAFYRTQLGTAFGPGAAPTPVVPLTGTVIQFVGPIQTTGNRSKLTCVAWQDSTTSTPDFGTENAWLVEFDATSVFQNLSLDAGFSLYVVGQTSGAVYNASVRTSEDCRTSTFITGFSASGQSNGQGFWPDESVQVQTLNQSGADVTQVSHYAFFYVTPPAFTPGENIVMQSSAP